MLAEATIVSPSRRQLGPPRHRPVLLRECLDLLGLPCGGTAIDCTVGLGGHTRAMLEAVGPTGLVVGLDRDAESLARARNNLREFGDRFLPVHADYRDLLQVLEEKGVGPIRGLLAMRLDRSAGPTASDLLSTLDEEEVERLIRRYGEEPAARRIARALARERRKSPISTTLRLASIVESAVGARRNARIHPATRTFQALRIAVNRELEGLEKFVEQACRVLVPGSRAAFIAFHSLEDRAVKKTLENLTPHCVCPPALPYCVCGRKGIVERVNRKAVRPGSEEMLANPRSRSARLRVALRLEEEA